jgi:hypothetical protein
MDLGYIVALAVAAPAIIPLIRWMAVITATLARGPGSNCPRCQSKNTRRAMPRTADVFFPAFLLAHRCEECESRFFVLQSVNYASRTRSMRSSRPLISEGAHSASRR